MPVEAGRACGPVTDIAKDTALLGRLIAIAGLAAAGDQLKKRLDPSASSVVEDGIEVDVPVRTAYNQFTQFEQFPQFMESVIEIKQLDDTHLQWRARVAGREESWQSEITFQVPDKRIAWRSTSGPEHSGVAMFQPLSENRTRVTLRMSYRPPGLLGTVGDALGAVQLELARNLASFKQFIEGRQVETGAWRGTVTGDVAVAQTGGGSSGTGASAASLTGR